MILYELRYRSTYKKILLQVVQVVSFVLRGRVQADNQVTRL
jgi:hypothetical protein